MRLLRLLPMLLVLLGSCELEDERDVCCLANTVSFRYMYRDTECFGRYVGSVRYFLFDASGRFIGEMPPEEGMISRVDISSLAPGSYTLVAVGNLAESGVLSGHVESGLGDFRLELLKDSGDAGLLRGNCDPLYRGECAFTVTAGASNRFTGEMSDIHCVLRVNVEWEGMPDYTEDFSLQLRGAAGSMPMDSRGGYSLGVHRFPPVEEYTATLRRGVAMRDLKLDATLVTLRWTDTDMPSLSLLHGDRTLIRDIDLRRVFASWRWRPSLEEVQEYALRIRIHTDNSVELLPGMTASVSDWVDGGSIG